MVKKEDFLERDFVSIEDFTKDEIDYILKYSEEFQKEFEKETPNNPSRFRNSLHGRVIAPLFFEDSTRTDLSFQRATLYLGANFLNFDSKRSSIGKGESVAETVESVDSLKPDLIIVRHRNDGIVRYIADECDAPVINAGDGQNQHPTQTILDLYSIKDIRGEIDGSEIIMAGDLKLGRTVHSLCLGLSWYKGCRVYFVAPESFEMPENLLKKLEKNGLEYSTHAIEELGELIKKVPLVYMTRIQRERFEKTFEGDALYKKVRRVYGLNLEMLEGVGEDFQILHPRPRIFEIDRRIDRTKFAYYKERQMTNGFYTRASLLKLIIGGGFSPGYFGNG